MSAFLGIRRERVFSPGRVDDDRAILDAVIDTLRAAGCAVGVVDGDDERWPEPQVGTVVFTMAQGDRALARLAAWERRGIRVVNTPEAILNCQRHRTVPLLTAAGIAFPESRMIATDAVPAGAMFPDGAWLKRGDVHATDPDDVVFVDTPAAFDAAVSGFRSRGIRAAVVQRHVPGAVVKFYAVRGRFFYGVRPPGGGLADSVHDGIDRLGQQAAAALGVEIYGGDCVCDPSGRLTLIDLNDWPSYARCRSRAASAIAAYIQEVTTLP